MRRVRAAWRRRCAATPQLWLLQFSLASLALGGVLITIPRLKWTRARGSFEFWTNSTGFRGELVSVDPKEILLYLNYGNAYACPYYSDRADLIAPEINRLAQFMRTFGAKVVFFTDAVEPTHVNGGELEARDNHLDETSPLLDDRCLFEDFDKAPAQKSAAIHREILYSLAGDAFVDEHWKVVRLAAELGAKYVIVAGMRCNYWVPALFEQLREAGMSPVYVNDLSDVAFYREAQKARLDTHVDALRHFWTWLVNHGYLLVNHFYLLDRNRAENPVAYKFDGNTDAYYFRDYFEK